MMKTRNDQIKIECEVLDQLRSRCFAPIITDLYCQIEKEVGPIARIQAWGVDVQISEQIRDQVFDKILDHIGKPQFSAY